MRADEADVSHKITCRIKELGPLPKPQRDARLCRFCFSEYLPVYLHLHHQSRGRELPLALQQARWAAQTSAVLFCHQQQDKFVPEIPLCSKSCAPEATVLRAHNYKGPKGINNTAKSERGFCQCVSYAFSTSALQKSSKEARPTIALLCTISNVFSFRQWGWREVLEVSKQVCTATKSSLSLKCHPGPLWIKLKKNKWNCDPVGCGCSGLFCVCAARAWFLHHCFCEALGRGKDFILSANLSAYSCFYLIWRIVDFWKHIAVM